MPEPYLAEAQDDATLLAIRAQEDAGLDIVTDGEIRRESYSNRFATALEGVDLDNPGTRARPLGPSEPGAAHRRHDPAQARRSKSRTCKFLQAHTTRQTKITVPGPFTMPQQAQNDFYTSEEEAAMDYAAAVNEEIRDLFAAGADVVQIDEPYMQARPEKARQYGLKALNRALDGIAGHDRGAHLLRLRGDHPRAAVAAIRSCPSWPAAAASRSRSRPRSRTSTARCSRSSPGKQIMVGCIDLSDMNGRDAGDGRRAHPPRAAVRRSRST